MTWWNPLSWFFAQRPTVIDLRTEARAQAAAELQLFVFAQRTRAENQADRSELWDKLGKAHERLQALRSECDALSKELGTRWRRRSNSKQQSRNLGYLQVPEELRLKLGWELDHVPWEDACFPVTDMPLFVCRVCGAAWLSSYLAKGCHSTSWPCQEDGCEKRARRPYTACQDCKECKATERYEKKSKKKWDGEGFVYSEALERFFTESEIYDYPEDDADKPLLPLKDLRLYLCEQDEPREFSFYEWCEDHVGEGDWNEDTFRDTCSKDKELLALEKQVNDYMKNSLRSFFGWVPAFDSPVLLNEAGAPA